MVAVFITLTKIILYDKEQYPSLFYSKEELNSMNNVRLITKPLIHLSGFRFLMYIRSNVREEASLVRRARTADAELEKDVKVIKMKQIYRAGYNFLCTVYSLWSWHSA